MAKAAKATQDRHDRSNGQGFGDEAKAEAWAWLKRRCRSIAIRRLADPPTLLTFARAA